MDIKSKEKIGNGLYIVAIVLLLIQCFQMGADIENSLVSYAGWAMLLIAGSYHFWLSQEKKKISNIESEN